MVIELDRPMELSEIMNIYGTEIVKECRDNNLNVFGMHFNTDKYLLAYYDYSQWCVLVMPIKWHHVKQYREHYDRHLSKVEEFKDIEFTIDMLYEMNLVAHEADEMFKAYEEKFLEEEKYELLQYLNDIRK